MSEKIIIIEDDIVLRGELSEFLTNKGYEVITLTDFENIILEIPQRHAHIILLDINLPFMSGLDICKHIRKHSNIPIIFLTASNTEIVELKSIIAGGDDFITKPYNKQILLEKIKRVLIKNNPEHYKEIKLKDVTLDIHLSTIKYNNNEVELTKNEFRILYYLFINQSQIVSSDELIEYLWINKLYIDENILNVNLARIRKKLTSIGLKDFVKNIRGQGFTL